MTRGDVAYWLARVLNWPAQNGAIGQSGLSGHYADVSGERRDVIETLYAHYINSELWDGQGNRTPDNKLLFRPDAPLSHADLFATLYLAQIGLGPLFNDNPVDGVNGREVPSAVYETVTRSVE